jgi:hypothetical protein
MTLNGAPYTGPYHIDRLDGQAYTGVIHMHHSMPLVSVKKDIVSEPQVEELPGISRPGRTLDSEFDQQFFQQPVGDGVQLGTYFTRRDPFYGQQETMRVFMPRQELKVTTPDMVEIQQPAQPLEQTIGVPAGAPAVEAVDDDPAPDAQAPSAAQTVPVLSRGGEAGPSTPQRASDAPVTSSPQSGVSSKGATSRVRDFEALGLDLDDEGMRLIRKFTDYRARGQTKLSESVTRLSAHAKLMGKIRDAALKAQVDEIKALRLGMGVSGAAISNHDAAMSQAALSGV